jgi:MFS family permease
MIGTTIEWYDFFIYALCAALVFDTQFFSGLGGNALIVSFATIGISFFFRPIGAAIAGHLGDRIGRRGTLIGTLLLMGVSTTLIGFLPTADSIGAAAPVLLVLLRMVQGLSAGGEWGGAALLAVEHAPAGRKGRFGAYPQLGAPTGMLLSNGVLAAVSAATSHDQFMAWGWRIPFFLSSALVVVGLLVRSRVSESPAFERVRETGARSRMPLVAVVRGHWRLLLAGALLFAANNAAGYMATGGYVQSYSVGVLHMDRTTILWAVMVGAAVWLGSTLLAGRLSDRYGRLPVYRVGFVLQLAWAFPFFALVNTASVGLVLVALVVYCMGLGLTYGPQAALYTEMFPAAVRYSGAALAYAVGAVLGGAFAPMIAEALQSSTGTAYSVAGYLAGMTVIGLIVALVVKERSGVRGPATDAPDAPAADVAAAADPARLAGGEQSI